MKVTAEVIGRNDLIVKVTWYYKSSGDEGNQNGILTNVTFLFFYFGTLRQVKRKRGDKQCYHTKEWSTQRRAQHADRAQYAEPLTTQEIYPVDVGEACRTTGYWGGRT